LSTRQIEVLLKVYDYSLDFALLLFTTGYYNIVNIKEDEDTTF